jgi:hypothetical protein
MSQRRAPSAFNVPHGDDDYAHYRWKDTNPSGFRAIADNIDWNRAVLQAMGYHMAQHNNNGDQICGPCLKYTLLNPIEGRR